MDGSELGLGGSPGRLCQDVWRAPVSASVRSEDESGANFPRASGFRSGARGRSDGNAEGWLEAPRRRCLLRRCMTPNLLVRGVHRRSGTVGRRRCVVGMIRRRGWLECMVGMISRICARACAELCSSCDARVRSGKRCPPRAPLEGA